MKNNKGLAIKLRRENKSYNEISKILKIPKSTLSDWFKNDPRSQKIKMALSQKSNPNIAKRIHLFTELNKQRWEKWREEARKEAKIEFIKLLNKPLFIAGLMLYWGEGDNKPKNPLRLTNTNPKVISLYVKFLITILRIPKKIIKINLILYPDLNEKKCLNFWSNITDINSANFYKTQFIKGRHPTKRVNNGICMIICNSRQLKEKILTWIDLLSNTL